MLGIMGFDRDQNAVKIGCSSTRSTLVVFFLFFRCFGATSRVGVGPAGDSVFGVQLSVFSLGRWTSAVARSSRLRLTSARQDGVTGWKKRGRSLPVWANVAMS